MLKFSLLFLFVILNCISFSQSYFFEKCSSQASVTDSKIVQTLNGPIRGECYNVPVSYSNDTTLNYDVFTWLSIPFAEPPIRENRFLKPKPVKSWIDIKDTLNWPLACIQYGYNNAPQYFSEDCLYLNVFVRGDSYLNRNKALKPIMVWIYGGSFLSGSSAIDSYEPSTLVASNDVIVITINYRINVFGFLHLADTDATGNAGFLDQALALEWIYKNAKSFGGDNSRITIFGESAGAWSVGFHLFHPPSWPYFRNAIMQSGAPTGSNNYYKLISSDEASNRASGLFNFMGCTNNVPSEALRCAQNKDPSIVLTSSSTTDPTARNNFDRLVINDIDFSNSVDQLVKKGDFKKCNIITGSNTDEFGYFLDYLGDLANDLETFNYLLSLISLPYKADQQLLNSIKMKYFGTTNLESLDQTNIDYINEIIQIQSDVVFVCPAFDFAELYTSYGKQAYAYEYKYNISSSLFPNLNAVHTEEIHIVFSEPLSNKVPPLLGDNDYAASNNNYTLAAKLFTEKVNKYWTDFCKYDDPNYSKSIRDKDFWMPFGNKINLNHLSANEKMSTGKFLLLTNDEISMTRDFSRHQCKFWNYTRDSNVDFSGANNDRYNQKSILILCLINLFVCLTFI